MRIALINMAVAESVDPKKYPPGTGRVIKGDPIWLTEKGNPITCPDYCHDPRAVKEMREVLSAHGSIQDPCGGIYNCEQSRFVVELIQIMNQSTDFHWPMFGPNANHIFDLIGSTPLQQTEAFLRTRDIWKPSKFINI
jgi:hypothetical protein